MQDETGVMPVIAGLQADSEWLYAVPWGFRKLLAWIHERYNGPDVYVLENGVDCPQESSVPVPGGFCIVLYPCRECNDSVKTA